jgi:hypothetical protein
MAQAVSTAFPDSLAPSSPARSAAWVLRFAVALACLGMGLPLVMGHQPSPLHAYLAGVAHLPGATASLIDTIAGVVLLLAGLAALCYPAAPIVVLTALWPAVQVWAAARTSESFSLGSMLACAGLVLAPLALLSLCHWPGRYAISRWRRHAAITLLRLGIAGAFIAHGVAAFSLDQHYANSVAIAVRFAFVIDLPHETTHWLLRLIGTLDIAAAVALLAIAPCAAPRMWYLELGHRVLVGVVAGLAVYQLESLREQAPFVAYLAAEGSHWMATPISAGAVVVAGAALAGALASWLTHHWRVLTIGMSGWGFVVAFGQFIEHGTEAPGQTLLPLALAGLPAAMYVMWNDLLQVSAAADVAARKGAAVKSPKAPAAPRQPRATEIPINMTPDRRPI